MNRSCLLALAWALLDPRPLPGQARPSAPCPAESVDGAQWQPTTTGGGVLRMPLAGDRQLPGLLAERQRFPAGYRSRPHVHTADLHIVVICGSVSVDLEPRDSAVTRPILPGGFLLIPAGTLHVERFRSETILHVQAVAPIETQYVDSATAARRSRWP